MREANMGTHPDTRSGRPEAGCTVENHGFSGIVVADCIYTHSQLTDQEKVGFTRTFLDIESINSLDIENLWALAARWATWFFATTYEGPATTGSTSTPRTSTPGSSETRSSARRMTG